MRKRVDPKFIDETGNVYGQLTVIRRATKEEMRDALNRWYQTGWLCKCVCGVEKIVCGTSLRQKQGGTRSCGGHPANRKGTKLNSHTLLEYNDHSGTLSYFSRLYRLPLNPLWVRIYRLKWPIERALTTPLRTHSARKYHE